MNLCSKMTVDDLRKVFRILTRRASSPLSMQALQKPLMFYRLVADNEAALQAPSPFRSFALRVPVGNVLSMAGVYPCLSHLIL